MTLPTHIILGAVIGKITGNYTLAIASSVAPDLDHFKSYLKSGVIKSPKKFWQTITDREDSYGDQRWILHNLILFVFMSAFILFMFPKIGLVIMLGWLGHITLDALDNSDYWPIYPNKKLNIRGPIKYASVWELILFLVFVLVFLII